MSCSGGEASLIADRAEGSGLEFAPFTDEHRQRIEPTLTDLVTVSNPFDYHTFMWGDRAAMARCFTAVMDGPQDATVLVLDAPPAPANDASAWLVAPTRLVDAAAATGRRAVVLATLAECLTEPLRERALAGWDRAVARACRRDCGRWQGAARGASSRPRPRCTPPVARPSERRGSSTRPRQRAASPRFGIAVPAGTGRVPAATSQGGGRRSAIPSR